MKTFYVDVKFRVQVPDDEDDYQILRQWLHDSLTLPGFTIPSGWDVKMMVPPGVQLNREEIDA